MKLLIIFAYVLLLELSMFVNGVHDGLNMILPPGGKECFFEEFTQDSDDREIDIFIPQNGNVDIILKVFSYGYYCECFFICFLLYS